MEAFPWRARSKQRCATNGGFVDATRDSMVIKNTASGARLPRFKTKLCHLLAVLYSEILFNYLTSKLYLSFFFEKIEIQMKPSSWGSQEDQKS